MPEASKFTRRAKRRDLIKYTGYSVYPGEIEDAIFEHPAVKLRRCWYACLDCNQDSESFHLLKEGIAATEEGIKRLVNSKLAPYKSI